MALKQTPELQASAPRRSLLPTSLLFAISIVLASCDGRKDTEGKPAYVAELQEISLPSSAITNISENSTRDERLLWGADVIRLATGNDTERVEPYFREFSYDFSQPDQWQLSTMNIGFGRDAGIEFVLVRGAGTSTKFKWELTDIFNQGDAAFAHCTQTIGSSGETISLTCTDLENQNAYGSALKQAKKVLEAEIAQQAQTSDK